MLAGQALKKGLSTLPLGRLWQICLMAPGVSGLVRFMGGRQLSIILVGFHDSVLKFISFDEKLLVLNLFTHLLTDFIFFVISCRF